jgi:hypothetical protein
MLVYLSIYVFLSIFPRGTIASLADPPSPGTLQQVSFEYNEKNSKIIKQL